MASRIPVVFLGIASDSSCSHVALAFHDGFFNMDSSIIDLTDGTVISPVDSPIMKYEVGSHCRYIPPDEPSDQELVEVTYIVNEIKKQISKSGFKILAAGVDSQCFFRDNLCHVLWNQYDILPFMFSLSGELEERADSASRKVTMWFGPDRIPRLTISFRNQVEVDNHCINMVQLQDYRRTVSPQTWKALEILADDVRSKNIRVAYFNATPQGGGVALMRHALMRLFALLKINATWHVPKPNPAVFRITKNNHNLFQGVAAPEISLTDDNIALYESWVESNCEKYWTDGPFTWCDVIVLDDPQVAGYIKYIKKVNPKCKVIYRSHIEIRSDLVMDKNKPQFKLWDYYYNFISQAELFISHPISGFVPSNVPKDKVLMMPACTDPLDGLNKDLSMDDCLYWIHSLNRLSYDQMGNRLHYPHRPYICQIARFDPAKGYPDVLKAYLKLRNKLDDLSPLSKIPQLLLCGHGSVDDPDSAAIYQELTEIINSAAFERIRTDICIVRVPPEDRILNAVLRCASVATQLSLREGFEIKVTESLQKGTPIIVYNAGGIPLQLPPDYPLVVDVGDVDGVVNHLFSLFIHPENYKALRKTIKSWASKDELWTVWQTINWLWLFKRVLEPESVKQVVEEMKPFHLVKNEWELWMERKFDLRDKWSEVLK